MNHRAPLRIGRDCRQRRPEMTIAVEAGVPHVPLRRPFISGAHRHR